MLNSPKVLALKESLFRASTTLTTSLYTGWVEPDSAKRRAHAEYAATLRDTAGTAVLDIVH